MPDRKNGTRAAVLAGTIASAEAEPTAHALRARAALFETVQSTRTPLDLDAPYFRYVAIAENVFLPLPVQRHGRCCSVAHRGSRPVGGIENEKLKIENERRRSPAFNFQFSIFNSAPRSGEFTRQSYCLFLSKSGVNSSNNLLKVWSMRDLAAAVAASATLLVLAYRAGAPVLPTEPPRRPAPARIVLAPPPPPSIELPAAEPSKNVPTLVEAGESRMNLRIKLLANELSKMWTRNPEELVTVIDEASREATTESPSVTLLLAIAHAETNGKILDVSEAGAVGLAQATPVACRQEGIDRKLFVTADYLIGSRAYIMKKPLGDADTIASIIVTKDTAANRKRAKRLLQAALDLRLEGVSELELLSPYASQRYFDAIDAAKVHNLKTLRELDRLLASGSKDQIRTYRDRVRREYRELKRVQLESWRRYQVELARKRDVMLEKHFGQPADVVKKTMPYEAGEYLGHHLDERFSARDMASFLVRHLERKAIEARKLAGENDDVEQMTAALYNGGSHNVKRMLAGLIGSLPETQKYMHKVPATRRRLDATIAAIRLPEGADMGR